MQTVESPTITKRRAKRRLIIMAAVVIGVSLAAWFSPLRPWFNDVDHIRTVVRSLGVWAPLAVMSYHILQVVIAPIPGQALDVANGYIFGWWGIAFSLIGISLGSMLAIWLARRFGRPLVRRLIGDRLMPVLETFVAKSRPVLWLLLLLPGTPDDLICYAFGLSTMRLRRAVGLVILGRAPGVVVGVVLGASGWAIAPGYFLLLAGALGIVVWWWTRRRLVRI